MSYPAPQESYDTSEADQAPSSYTTEEKPFRVLQTFRLLIAGIITFFLAKSLDLGVAFGFLLSASWVGVILAGRALKLQRSFLWVLSSHALLFLLLNFCLKFANLLSTATDKSEPSADFFVPLLSDEVFLVLLFYSFSFLSTWFFWTFGAAATWEGLLYTSAFIWLMSGHRNYHIDAPKQVSSQTWKLEFLQSHQVEPQHLFIGLAVAFFCALSTYFYFASNRPLFRKSKQLTSLGKKRFFTAPLIPFLLLAALFYYSKLLNERYSADLGRASEGVGQAAKEGESNLGFHKAVGQTNQPAALVRLEGDYENNPWSPMLYFREGALSEFNGKELVTAPPQFDIDVPRIQPGQPYIAITKEAGAFRDKVVQSVYLLMKHNAPFAVDFPTRMGLIKNPDPERFALAYQAISQAPNVKVTDLIGNQVGDPKWDSVTLEHYLRAPGSLTRNPPEEIPLLDDKPVYDDQHEDLRYLALERQLAGSLSEPLARSEAIINYLSQESVYTRDPGHQVTAEGDPVAPYLFAPPKKKRGYCVHFAHAAVYLLRLAGIPARIGTGYLTDLQYAKDGHILLQMGDRHAWPEIYVDGLGWTIVDVNPAQAENEQVPVPDAKLLEELMGKINPTEELIAPPEIAHDASSEPSVFEQIINSRVLVPALYALLAGFLLLKLWLRFGYRLVLSDRRRARLAYASFASELSDLGYERLSGETRREFERRIKSLRAFDAHSITLLNERHFYSGSGTGVTKLEAAAALKEWRSSHDRHRWKLRRYAAIFNPRSLLRLWSW